MLLSFQSSTVSSFAISPASILLLFHAFLLFRFSFPSPTFLCFASCFSFHLNTSLIYCKPHANPSIVFYPETASRKLEDIDRLFRENDSILIFRDKDAISSKRPQAYIEHEQTEVRRNSSVVSTNPEMMKRRLERMSLANQEITEGDVEKGGFDETEKV